MDTLLNLFTPLEQTMIIKLTLAVILGVCLGIQRETRGKNISVRTLSFVVLGACLFTSLGVAHDNEVMRVAASVITGIGFLGAGIIIKGNDGLVQNVTTAACIRVAAAIGMSIGVGEYVIAALTTLYAVIIFNFPHYVEEAYHKELDQVAKDAKKGKKHSFGS